MAVQTAKETIFLKMMLFQGVNRIWLWNLSLMGCNLSIFIA